ncbi:DUF2029 domain-containing protein [Novosphingobium flavum]|uniref:DUF2029 domain-containing protein n=1 Tax=Novosphingobium flavum TaxID=1778672 RepID=A0A7X1FTY2_9SPHN|nr:glycosyltransferase family 87 protein [Novosphingobium flavum]MBC2666908.1 DUF2029 domain-containing protein [Novosphingobium flavum]
MKPRSPLVAGLTSNRLFAPLVIASMLLCIAANAWLLSHPNFVRVMGVTDFQDFYVVGQLALNGKVECAYEWECLRQAQLAHFHDWQFMPWAYPPPFTAVVEAFATLPHALSYGAFTGLTFCLYCLAVYKLAGRYSAFALALTIPAMLINVRCGQNGFLTAGLVGLFAQNYLERGRRGGLALGAMIIKPHLAVACAFLVLIDRRWRTTGQAIAIAIAAMIVATIALGAPVWEAFRDSSEASTASLMNGEFPIGRMTSAYAMAYRFEWGASLAMALQIVVALFALASIFILSRRCKDDRMVLSYTIAASMFVSPYNYDYDLTFMAIALALIAPVAVQYISGLEMVALGALSWLSAANFALASMTAAPWGFVQPSEIWSISFPCLLGMCAILANAVRRRRATGGATIAPSIQAFP